MAYIPLKRKSKAKKGRKPLRRNKKVVPKVVKKYVKKAIHAQIENKIQNIDAANSFGSIQEDATLGAYPMMPYTGYWSISQGVTQNTRVGNKIRPIKVYLNYTLFPNAYNAATNPAPYPVVVDLFLGYHRQNPSLLPNSTLINELFQRGNSQLAPQGNLDDIISQVNTDSWIIKKRWQHRVGYSVATGTGSSPNYEYYANNDFKYSVTNRINITRLMPKSVIFNDSGSMMNRNLFFFHQAVPASGATGLSTVQPVTMRYWIHFEYEDA